MLSTSALAVGPAPTKKLVLGSFVISALVESPEDGRFVRFIREVFKRADIEIDIKILSPNRARFMLARRELDGVFPHFARSKKITKTIQTPPFFFKQEQFVVTKGAATIDFAKKNKVCIPKGFHSGWYLDLTPSERVNTTVMGSVDDESCLKMLVSGRIDAVLIETQSGRAAIKKLGLDTKVEMLETILASTAITLILQAQALTPAQFKRISKVMSELRPRFFPTGKSE